MPFSFLSHVTPQLRVGKELVRRGHEVFVLISESLPNLEQYKREKDITVITHTAERKDIFLAPQDEVDALFRRMHKAKGNCNSFRLNEELWLNMGLNPLEDETLVGKLRDLKFDLAIFDMIALSRCMLPIVYKLGIPYVGFETAHEQWLLRNPSPPSYVPSNMYDGAYTTKMNFWERLDNLWAHISWAAFTGVNLVDDSMVQKYMGDKPLVTLNYLAGKSLIWLIDNDMVMGYPRPVMPNEIYVGGLTTGPGSPLPAHIKAFLDSASEGAVLMTFGSSSVNIAEKPIAEFVGAFKKVNMKVIWKYINVPDGISDNVLVLDWVPQNDILAHPNVKVFITHCGANGQFEGLYHGVPMIGFPYFADQFYNCHRAVYHGVGACFELMTFEADDLVDSIHDLAVNKSARAKIQQMSQIFRDRLMTPVNRSAYWVEHVLKYGGAHLRAHALDMPWYEYLMVDILGLVFGVLLATATLGCVSVWMIVRWLHRKRSSLNVTHEVVTVQWSTGQAAGNMLIWSSLSVSSHGRAVMQ